MANPRQRKKARSSSYRPVSHSKHAKRNLKKTPPIRGPKALQEAWDKECTVRQNYARLGLVVSLDPSANGGVEQVLGQCSQVPTSLPTEGTSKGLPDGFGRIIRDDSGNVIHVELDHDEPAIRHDPEDIDNVESRIDANVRQRWVNDFTVRVPAQDGTLIKELESMSASSSGSTTLAIPLSRVRRRHVCSGELKYIQPLVKKYGGNVESMASDLRLNPEQRTAGELRRLLRKAGVLIQD